MRAANARAGRLASGLRECPRARSGLTLVELIIVICIIGLAAAFLVDRLRFYQEAAEKAAMEYTVGAVKSALQLRVAAMLVRGEEKNIESLARANPIDWLTEPPRGYRGEFRSPQPAVPPGSWYFDANSNQLVYVPNLDGHLERLTDGSKRIRFRVRLDFAPAKPDSGRKQGVLAGTWVEPVMPYTWF